MDKKKEIKKNRVTKPVLISCVIIVVIGYLIYTGLRDTMTYYLTVSELMAQPAYAKDQTVKVGGIVIPDSVKWDNKELRLVFRLQDEKSSLNVDYRGVVPDSFKPGKEVVLEGTYSPDGGFKATTIMPKCASKYE